MDSIAKYQKTLNKLTLIDMLCTVLADFAFSLIAVFTFSMLSKFSDKTTMVIAYIIYLIINFVPLLIKTIKYDTPIHLNGINWTNNTFNVYCNIPDSHYRELVRQAAKAWNKCSRIHIQITNDINKAQIRIYTCFAQSATWAASTTYGNCKLSLPITLNSYYLNQYDDSTIRATIEHELGHAMGLGHSAGKSSVMYPFTQKREITALDRYNLNKLY